MRRETGAGVVRYNVVTVLACVGGFVLLQGLAGASLEVVGTMVRVVAWIVTFVLVTRVIGHPLDVVEALVRGMVWLATVLAVLGLVGGPARHRRRAQARRTWGGAPARGAVR